MRHFHAMLSVFLASLFGLVLPATGQSLHGVIPKRLPTEDPQLVCIRLPDGWSETNRTAIKIQVAGESAPLEAPAQIEPPGHNGEPARLWFLWKVAEKQAGQSVTVTVLDRPAAATAYKTTFDGPQLHITDRTGKPILSFWHGEPKAGLQYPMTSFIYPLFGLDGEELTALSPGDHPHHRSVYWAWVRHELDGKDIGDWWQPRDIHAEPGKLSAADGPLFSRFSSRHVWVHQPAEASTGQRFIEELVVCRVYKQSGECRIVDVDLTLHALADRVRIGGTLAKDKGYGGFSVRFNKAEEVQIVADGKLLAKDLNQLRAHWGDWTGKFVGADGKPAARRSGAAIMVAADHPDRPPYWITRSYGPMNVSYPGLEMVEIPKDKPLHLNYRLLIHRGDAREARIAEHYAAYTADWKWSQ